MDKYPKTINNIKGNKTERILYGRQVVLSINWILNWFLSIIECPQARSNSMFIILSVDYRDFCLYVCPVNRQRLFSVKKITSQTWFLVKRIYKHKYMRHNMRNLIHRHDKNLNFIYSVVHRYHSLHYHQNQFWTQRRE